MMQKSQMDSIVRIMSKPDQPPSRTADQFVVRLPDGMRDRIAQEAKSNNRSMNAEIVARLEESLDAPDREAEKTFETEAVMNAFRDTIADIARNDNERDEIVRSIGQDLHAVCGKTLPMIEDDEEIRSLVRMLADVGIALQSGDLTDAKGQLRAAYYLSMRYALNAPPPPKKPI